MKDLILRTRIEMLKQNLGQVKRVVDSVQERGKELQELLDLLEGPQQSIQSTEDALNAIQRSITLVRRLRSADEVKGVLDKLQEAETAVEGILIMLDKAAEMVKKMQSRSVQIDDDLRSTLRVELVNRAARSISSLEEIYDKRKQAEEAERKNDLATAGLLLQEAWKDYLDEIYKDSQRIFEEYIDFLGGLALRDTNFDLGVCQIADKLIRKWVSDLNVRWLSLTIPARRETLEMSLARIIRLGFPEWTIWALPLTAHGFGYVVIGQSSHLEQYIKDQPLDALDKTHLHSYLADAFATYAMGPAYACAAILLRFDPLLAHEDKHEHPGSAMRAHVLFTMLEQMDKISGGAYKFLIERLEDEWMAALQQVKSSDALQDSDKEQLERWVSYLWTYIEDNMGELYSYRSWISIQDWPEKLLQYEVEDEVEDISLNHLEDLRDVLNAAWLCRIEHPEKTDTIARAAKALWKRIDKRDRIRKRESENRNAPSGINTRSSKRR